MMTDKISAHHLARKAILYVRQSSPHQVLHNRESRTLQYAMRDRLTALGFSDIETIDDDLERSAAGGVARAGFDRTVADVCLGKVGAVAAGEVSRFARNSRDWQQLIEMCRVVDTLLVDQETIYAPRLGNDRLLGSSSPLGKRAADRPAPRSTPSRSGSREPALDRGVRDPARAAIGFGSSSCARIASFVSEGRDREPRFGDFPPAMTAASSFRASMLTCGGPRLMPAQ